MEFTFFTLFIVVTIIVVIAFLFLPKGTFLETNSITKIITIVAIFGLSITGILFWFFPDVTVVTNNGETFDHSTKTIIGPYKGQSLSFFNSYIDNQTDKELILYPIVYGESDSDPDVNGLKETIFKLKSVEKIGVDPDFYFEKIPDQISVQTNIIEKLWDEITGKKSKEIKWSLEINQKTE